MACIFKVPDTRFLNQLLKTLKLLIRNNKPQKVHNFGDAQMDIPVCRNSHTT